MMKIYNLQSWESVYTVEETEVHRETKKRWYYHRGIERYISKDSVLYHDTVEKAIDAEEIRLNRRIRGYQDMLLKQEAKKSALANFKF